MPLYNVSQLKATLGGGAKTDRFTVEFGIPQVDQSINLNSTGPILLKTAQVPERTIGKIEVYGQGGRLLKLPGNTEYNNPLQMTFYQTADHDLRGLISKWQLLIDNYWKNTHTCDVDSVMVEVKLHQLGCDGEETKTYTFFNVWPDSITEVELDTESVNQIEQFTVTFAYSHWE